MSKYFIGPKNTHTDMGDLGKKNENEDIFYNGFGHNDDYDNNDCWKMVGI